MLSFSGTLNIILLLGALQGFIVVILLPAAVMLIYRLGQKGYFIIKVRRNKSLQLSLETIQTTLSSLRNAMTRDKLYLDPTLNIGCVVRHINVSHEIISVLLSEHFEKSFNEFVNEYRIEEFKRRILETQHQHLTIAGIALECGFDSLSNFQRAFKYFTGLSPAEYFSQQTPSMISA
jgi:AraC-like DNA-binding protein